MYTLSDGASAVFDRAVMDRVKDDPRTVGNSWFGYPFELIRDSVIEKGLADFTQGYTSEVYENLSALDRCLLYAFSNARKHYKMGRDLMAKFGANVGLPAAEPTLLVDLGSGPATFLMAYADAFPGKKIEYIAIDRAEHMLGLAEEIFTGLKAEGVIAPESSFQASTSWEGLEPGAGKPTIIAASFLFASASALAQCESLANFARKVMNASQDSGRAFVYLNSEYNIAAKGWIPFSQRMGWKPETRVYQVEGESNLRYAATIMYKRGRPNQ